MWRNENKGKRREEKKEVRRMEEDKNTLGLHPEVREEDRVAKAVALFREGYNCSQSVVTAFADLYGFTREQALHMSASFGGGIGRMRETCGAACGMFLLAGLEKCAVEGKDRESKAANYALVQELAEEFKKRNGALRCADLLGLSRKEPVVSTPEARTEQYYAKRPCARMVEEAARIWSEHLEKQKNRLKIAFSYRNTNFFDAKVLNNIILCIFASDKKHKHSHRNVWVRLTFN